MEMTEGMYPIQYIKAKCLSLELLDFEHNLHISCITHSHRLTFNKLFCCIVYLIHVS
jgi:hypothetical protein